jgi:hypothetical protein
MNIYIYIYIYISSTSIIIYGTYDIQHVCDNKSAISATWKDENASVFDIRLHQMMMSPKFQDLLSQICNNIPKSTHFGLKVMPTNMPPPLFLHSKNSICERMCLPQKQHKPFFIQKLNHAPIAFISRSNNISIFIQRKKEIKSRLDSHITFPTPSTIRGPTLTN